MRSVHVQVNKEHTDSSVMSVYRLELVHWPSEKLLFVYVNTLMQLHGYEER